MGRKQMKRKKKNTEKKWRDGKNIKRSKETEQKTEMETQILDIPRKRGKQEKRNNEGETSRDSRRDKKGKMRSKHRRKIGYK